MKMNGFLLNDKIFEIELKPWCRKDDFITAFLDFFCPRIVELHSLVSSVTCNIVLRRYSLLNYDSVK